MYSIFYIEVAYNLEVEAHEVTINSVLTAITWLI